ncbi:DUF2169 domain-containing protein [Massilia sp. DJPM01]|uniref:DUF2169 family type VI secretion system accessory protein n=1 Tax=Massilia sp. DJPM01 TaxID=3024404 RepID=UPI00259FA659|nr:DUF2169 domain-containing protein [Massilia sp. DJPM01]MDM5179743.1 DUF2169 domain-containing protein [Massilia sp. DJPM01]
MFPSIPSLRFDNRTGLDALHFDTIDQNGVAFHVVVAKTAYRFDGCDEHGHARLVSLEDPAPLYTDDMCYQDDTEQSVRCESDLAPYKPHCDVIVVGSAHAPGGKPVRRFGVRLHLQLPDQPAPLPERPFPLNPMQPLSFDTEQAWKEELALAERTMVPGRVLIDKVLTVTGERELQRRLAPVRLAQLMVAVVTLGLVQLNRWRLTTSAPSTSVPLRYEYAQGGQCVIPADGKGAKRVPKRHRLTRAQQEQYSYLLVPPAALDASQVNPIGCGFAPRWYLRASGLKRLPAPRIEYAHAPFTARRFWQSAVGRPVLVPAGFGYVGRAWLPRRSLVGTIETKSHWEPDEVPALPKDFDFAYWNGAPQDQQCEHLAGGERLTLTNLCAPGAPFARADSADNTVLSFALPQQSPFLLATNAVGAVAAMPLAIDTVLIDAEAGQVELSWRLCIVADGEFADARLLQAANEEQLGRLAAWNTPPDRAAAPTSPHAATTV